MKVLIAPTEDFNRRERAQLAAAASAGSSINLAVDNSANYAIGDFIVVGLEGSDAAEICQITAVPDATHLTVATLALAHLVDEPVVKYRYNQRKFYGSLTGGAGTFTELVSSGSPVTIMVNNPQGTLIEYTGGDGFTYFLATYYNSTTLDETAQTESTTVLADDTTRYCSLYQIRKQAGLTNNPYIDDGQMEIWRKRAENEVQTYIYERYVLPLQNLTTGANEVPSIIENATVLLAAGYADYKEFGKDGQGVKWLGEARGILRAIQKGTQRLIGTDYQEMVLKTLTHGVQSAPRHSRDRKFGMDQNF